MKVKPNQLELGCILSKDVLTISDGVLMRKKTVLTEEYIHVLKAFLVDAVEVEATLVNGQPFTPKEVIEPEIEETKKSSNKSFIDLYLEAVQTYTDMFKSWQAGSKVDILGIRQILLPLLDKLGEQPNELISLHHYAAKEAYIFHHAVTLGLLSAYLGKKLNYSKAEQIQLGIAGMMSDSGMAKIPYRILEKKGPLTALEYDEIKKHPLYSYQMIKDVPGITEAVLVGILQHHEREDSTGYPMKLPSTKLHKFSRIIAVIDIFHAMTSERPYKAKQSPYRVIELIIKDNFGKYDLNVVRVLCNLIANFIIGDKVRLNNNDIAEVIFIEPHAPTRPMVKVEDTGEIIKLANRSDLYLEEVIV
ncbi:phosphohydrolase [Anaerobacillus alkalidiazotrophicus]|uniref:Phosphohydrolase n=1 Tax=Anaerobacillus alkalidiazotrophicus TaxID=472963 RepID=A0A1S2MAZ5_9BACI|nr:HD-GYP domain-containing protein [Anaerobacillus alkalidiazotrophicus]OIJ21928.1 phosphohydrolase [Anaerobacillus alkalidiazotrophicus]